MGGLSIDNEKKCKEYYMECARLKKWNAYMNKRKILSRLDLDGGYTGNIYLMYVRLYIQP